MMTIQRQFTMAMTVIGLLVLGAQASAQELPTKVSLQLNIKCEAVTDKQERYLVFASLVKKLETSDEILNDYLAPGSYVQFELTAVPVIGGNRSDDAIMEKFNQATVDSLKDPQGNQLSATQGAACRVSESKEIKVAIHFSENAKNQPLKIFGINSTKTVSTDFGNSHETTTKKFNVRGIEL